MCARTRNAHASIFFIIIFNLLVKLLLETVSQFVTFGFSPVEAGRITFACLKPKRMLRYGAPVDSFLGGVSLGVVRPDSLSLSTSNPPVKKIRLQSFLLR